MTSSAICHIPQVCIRKQDLTIVTMVTGSLYLSFLNLDVAALPGTFSQTTEVGGTDVANVSN